MKIDFSRSLSRHYGAVFEADVEPLRLDTVALTALTSATASDQRANAEQKVKLYRMAQRLSVGGELEITPEDLTFLRARIAEVCVPMVVGAAFDLLG